MRIYLRLTHSKVLLPFNYQHLLAGALHKWLGSQNPWHGNTSLYSFSWLQGMESAGKAGLKTGANPYFFFSAYEAQLTKALVQGILKDPYILEDLRVADVQVTEPPNFSAQERFTLASPVLIKKYLQQEQKHLTFQDAEASELLTRVLQNKLEQAGLPADGARVCFDTNYPNPKIKTVAYRNIKNKVSLCPVLVSGTPEQISFAWHTGIGNSTGIGFGALK